MMLNRHYVRLLTVQQLYISPCFNVQGNQQMCNSYHYLTCVLSLYLQLFNFIYRCCWVYQCNLASGKSSHSTAIYCCNILYMNEQVRSNGGMILTAEHRNTEGKIPVPVLLFPPRISHELAWYRTQACSDRPATNSLSCGMSYSYLVAVAVTDDTKASLFNLLTSGVVEV
jgi:hypothetical protein